MFYPLMHVCCESRHSRLMHAACIQRTLADAAEFEAARPFAQQRDTFRDNDAAFAVHEPDEKLACKLGRWWKLGLRLPTGNFELRGSVLHRTSINELSGEIDKRLDSKSIEDLRKQCRIDERECGRTNNVYRPIADCPDRSVKIRCSHGNPGCIEGRGQSCQGLTVTRPGTTIFRAKQAQREPERSDALQDKLA
jgi:hypothetical protein